MTGRPGRRRQPVGVRRQRVVGGQVLRAAGRRRPTRSTAAAPVRSPTRRRRSRSPPASGNSKSISRSRSRRPICRSVMSGGQRTQRGVVHGHHRRRERLGRGVDRPPHRVLADLRLQFGREVGGERIGGLQHRVHQRAELRALRQVGHRRRRRPTRRRRLAAPARRRPRRRARRPPARCDTPSRLGQRGSAPSTTSAATTCRSGGGSAAPSRSVWYGRATRRRRGGATTDSSSTGPPTVSHARKRGHRVGVVDLRADRTGPGTTGSPGWRPRSSRDSPPLGSSSGRRPPRHHLRLRAGQRDVGEPDVVAGGLARGPAAAPRCSRGCPCRRCAGSGSSPSWNSTMSRLWMLRLNANGRYTIGYCRPLLTHTVMICTAAASLSSRRLRSVAAASLVALAAQPVAQRGQAVVLAVRGVLQQLRQVRQVGHVPFAVVPRQHPVAPCPPAARPRRPPRRRARARGRPTRATCPRSGRSARRRRRPGLRRSRRRTSSSPRRAPARRGAAGRTPPADTASRRRPASANTSESPVYTAGMPAAASASKQAPASLCVLHDHRDVAGPAAACRRTSRRWPAVRRCRRRGPRDVRAQLVDRDTSGSAPGAERVSRAPPAAGTARCAAHRPAGAPGGAPRPRARRCRRRRAARRAAPPAGCRPARASLRQLVPSVRLLTGGARRRCR